MIGIIDVLHLTEQMVFGLGELVTLKQVLGVYDGWFQQPDYGMVVLMIIASATLFSVVFSAMQAVRDALSRADLLVSSRSRRCIT